jgi:hypothetical protein
MSIAAVAGSLFKWGLRGAIAGVAVDLGRTFFQNKFEPRNTIISAVHGLAIGVIGNTIGTGAAVGAFIASSFAVLPALFFENVPVDHDEGIKMGVKIRLVATLIGTAVGSIF